MHSDEELGDTKPSWTLSDNRREYLKVFAQNEDYTTPVYDLYGNEVWVKIKILKKSYNYENKNGPNIKIKYLYDSNNKVTVYIISDTKLKDTKETWNLDKNKTIYSKTFTNNQIYTTPVEDIYGNIVDANIIVNFFKNTYKGIDVSAYQKIIDWNSVKNEKIDFAIIRAAYRGWATGKIVTDSYFDTNIKEANKVGMNIGIYFFSQAITEEEAKEEARYAVNLVSKHNIPLKYPIVIDTEATPQGDGRADKLSKNSRTKIVKAFCEEIKRLGYKPMIYANKYWLMYELDIEVLKEYDIWLAHYTTQTDYQYSYSIWQYKSTGKVKGISTDVDMNIGYKNY